MDDKIPDVIYLQWNNGENESSWCSDKTDDNDIEYHKTNKLTIDELREQFEEELAGSWLDKCKNGDYMDDRLDSNWEAYERCARANNIIKE